MPSTTTLSHKAKSAPLVQFLRIYKSYGISHRVFEDVSLEISRGDFIFLLGPSGGGKSTFLKLLFGAESPDRGHILFEGRSLQRMTPKEMPYFRRRTGMVLQDVKLIRHRTVYENVALPLEIAGRDSSFIESKVLRVLQMLGFANRRNSVCAHLSTSEQQMVAIARAVVNDPLLLLLDEPTGKLDKDAVLRVMGCLGVIRARGTTVIITSHEDSLHEAILDARALTIAEGKISEIVTASEAGFENSEFSRWSG